MPGVPDFYQGTEFWDFSLVDPDNRRPVDFATRATSLDDAPLDSLTRNWRDGRIKQAVIAHTLALRRACPALFVKAATSHSRCAAHSRIGSSRSRAGAATTWPWRLSREPHRSMLRTEQDIVFDRAGWRDTCVETHDPALTSLFRTSEPAGASISVGALLSEVPVALLISPAVQKAMLCCSAHNRALIRIAE